ncbi:MAG: riboflavin synthase, partial [Agromyces sp.]
MFTGLIEEIGEIVALEHVDDSVRLTVRGPVAVSDAVHGASISVSGVCLTVIEQSHDTFTADVMAQSLKMSALSAARVGTKVNLERAAALGDRLGGHIVQGHVDGTG